ncbi:hypothetical protein GWK47_009465 [Chionoecetes opilio]|uniref:Uncharacterized protein n=1 Tax=Chionoecetes opilio TaxID=41210 RepID=A0A8J5CPL2_CHIOP|nr:hypothetical protein GWK47_009465 [Chionoecetes opilio]
MVLLDGGRGQLASQRRMEHPLQQQRTAFSAVVRTAAGRRRRRAAQAGCNTCAFTSRPQTAAAPAAAARGLHQLQHHARTSLQRQRIIPLVYMPRSTRRHHSPQACPASTFYTAAAQRLSPPALSGANTPTCTPVLTPASPSDDQHSQHRAVQAEAAALTLLHNTTQHSRCT